MNAFRYVLVLPLLFLTAGSVLAQDAGTAAEAKAMLEKVVSDASVNKAKTLRDINAGAYNKKDLYPFCGAADGTFTAHGADKPRLARA